MRVVLTLCLILPLAGCLSTSKKASSEPRPAASSSRAAASSASAAGSSVGVYRYGMSGGAAAHAGMHTVASGETLWTISKNYQLSMQDIIAVNNLSPPYAIGAGTRLILPPPARYKVRPDDSLYVISRTFNVSQRELAQLNSLRAPYNLRPGQELKLPTARRPAPPPVAAQPTMMARAGQASGVPQMAAVRPGTVTAEPLSAPGGAPSVTSSPASKPGSAAPAVMANADPALPQPVSKPQPVSRPVKVAANAPARAASKFAWPVKGKVISGYGPKDGGLHNDGINIQAARGTPVHAAENGVIVYAGNELKGFGNLVLVKHADRWLTAYAHLDNITVTRGQEVKLGQSIGTVGSTGSVSAPQLHFETRRGTEALNPMIYLAQTGS